MGTEPEQQETLNRMRWVADGVYRDTRTGHYFERPWLAGRRTWRRLDAVNLRLAREALAQRRTDAARAARGMARDPYGPKSLTVGAVLEGYTAAGCPDRSHRPRTGAPLDAETARVRLLLPFWSGRLAESIDPIGDAQAYFQHRARLRKGEAHGGRAVDLDLSTLSNALAWAVRARQITTNPLASGRPRFRSDTVRHCREFAPQTADELHALAAHFFEAEWHGDHRSAALGWQLLLEAMTGCRTSEVLALRRDAAPGRPGWRENGWLWLDRRKGGVNPFALVHDALGACLTALDRWHEARRHRSPWYLPGRDPRHPLDVGALAHGLHRASELVLGRRVTSHGLRSYYVTARRSQGIPDAQIAAEIGDQTGAAIIASTYGAVPPNWRGGDPVGWVPAGGEPAWVR